MSKFTFRKPPRIRSSLWPLGLVAAALAPTAVLASPSVNVALSASFNSPPYLVELLETAAEENATSYFPLLDRIADGTFADSLSEKDLYERFLEVLWDDGHIADADALSSFKFALSIHSTAPRIQAHYQYYNTSVEPSLMVAQDAVCQVWAHYDGSQYCSPTLEHAQQAVSGNRNERVLPFDRTLGDHENPLVLYADITAPSFTPFHNELSSRARQGEFSYRVRYRPSASETEQQPLYVSGYGVELVLKRTDYIVIDDRDADETSSETNSKQDAKQTLAVDDLNDEDELSDLKPLSASEVSRLGTNAADFVMASDDPFEALLQLCQDFPRHSSVIAQFNTTASDEATEDFPYQDQDFVLSHGHNMMWINGAKMSPRHVDAFSLLTHLRQERRLINSFREVGLSSRESVDILTNPAVSKSHASKEMPRYDYRDETEGGNVIIWLNDIEKDSRYKDWPKSLNALLRPSFPGQMPTVRRDIHNVVFPVDLADADDVSTVIEDIQRFVKKQIPARFGLVPTLQNGASVEQARIVWYLHETYGLGALVSYLEQSLSAQKTSAPDRAIFEATTVDLDPRDGRTSVDFGEVLATDRYDSAFSNTKAYLRRMGADGEDVPLFVNGAAINKDEDWMQRMVFRVSRDMEGIQRGVIEDRFEDDAWLPHYYLSDALPTRNLIIVPKDPNEVKVLNLNELYREHQDVFARLSRIPAAPETSLNTWAQLILVADLDKTHGLEQLRSVLDFRMQFPGVEVLLQHTPASSSEPTRLSSKISELLRDGQDVSPDELRSLLEPDVQDTKQKDHDLDASHDLFRNGQSFISALGLENDGMHLIVNGRVVGPLSSSSLLDSDALEHLFAFERKQRIDPVTVALLFAGLESKISGPASLAKLTSLVALSTESDIPEGLYDSGPVARTNNFAELKDTNMRPITLSQPDDAPVEIVSTIDPSAEVAQRWVPILRVLSRLSGVAVKIYLNPRRHLKELPIMKFYRHVLDATPSFSGDGALMRPQATFNNVPGEALLTLGMDVPPSWLVTSKDSVHDLDNLQLSTLKPGTNVDATYELEHILVEGHSRDTTAESPPRGVQLQLGTEEQPHFADTIIMANLGYFQFKAQPGCWEITLKPGESERIFNIDSVGALGSKPTAGDENNEVALLSFQGKTLFPRLSRKPGHEEDDVLDETGSRSGSAMNYLSKGFNMASNVISSVTKSRHSQHADINIFSVASGHLYERMLSIMMLSVMRHTEHSVKFWFIEQFLSPSFKSFLPHLAEEYGFSYEMVTYKWPHWLRAQREKQREIWGYKILFLDVLFPLSLDKVIFVDADQIVRTDMYDLVTLDLEGAPYGFTPMCDSRTSMEGFRFWKQGYWAKFLRGRPYHISALYVVDLNRFRQIAAGDRLRGQYHALSADPNSLSNLDQDLPNHMQHVLRIKSLPQDWLWCETWCSDEALETAKTIDMCNNPETKEPKLDRARRQVPEWTQYDEEIARLAKKVARAEDGGEGDGGEGEREGVGAEDVAEHGGKERDRKDEL